MGKILMKEIRLSNFCLPLLFTLFGLMFFLPGYPVLCGAFFVSLGIFKGFQYGREANDILFSALLPIAKRDVVKGKFLYTAFIQGCGLLLMAVGVAVRMTALRDAPVYVNNALMNANGFALGLAFCMFGLFNAIFVGGFFKTAYKFGGPFIAFMIAAFAVIGAGEALHYFPGLGFLNAFGMEYLTAQILLFSGGAAVYLLLTVTAYFKSCKRFEAIDL